MILRGFVHSEVLEKDTGITIVTPHKPYSEKYKVAYLLHGLGGEQSTWTDFSMLPYYALEGNTIYIMPNAERSFYTDMKYGFKFFTYVTEDLPKICKSVFNISADPCDTAVIGVSMGGYGALKCAMAKPENYGMCGAIAPACLFLKDGLEAQNNPAKHAEILQKYGQSILNDMIYAFGENLEADDCCDLPTLAKKISGRDSIPKFYTACGLQDPYHDDNMKFKDLVQELGIGYKYEEWQGGHELPFFNDALRKVIDYFGL
ncbi:MAG: acetylesterase [Clostridiales bacterium]|nr:MAG: acetylesterase [Clostridiales bacterium]